MAFITGTANSLASLLSALTSALTANGWVADSGIYSKGSCYVKPEVANMRPDGNGMPSLVVRVGTGAAAGVLTNPSYKRHRLGGPDTTATGMITYPANFFIHINTAPDEVYLVVNYGVDFYKWIAFGASPAAGITGSGVWSAGTYGVGLLNSDTGNLVARTTFSITAVGGGGGNNDETCGAFFWNTATNGLESYPIHNACFHHGLDPVKSGWACMGSSQVPNAVWTVDVLVSRSPNAWNGEAILIPIKPMISLGFNKMTMVGDIRHARYIRVDNYTPGDIITLGTDKWKVYPFYKKDTVTRNGGGGGLTHTGTFGWALRYDGP